MGDVTHHLKRGLMHKHIAGSVRISPRASGGAMVVWDKMGPGATVQQNAVESGDACLQRPAQWRHLRSLVHVQLH